MTLPVCTFSRPGRIAINAYLVAAVDSRGLSLLPTATEIPYPDHHSHSRDFAAFYRTNSSLSSLNRPAARKLFLLQEHKAIKEVKTTFQPISATSLPRRQVADHSHPPPRCQHLYPVYSGLSTQSRLSPQTSFIILRTRTPRFSPPSRNTLHQSQRHPYISTVTVSSTVA